MNSETVCVHEGYLYEGLSNRNFETAIKQQHFNLLHTRHRFDWKIINNLHTYWLIFDLKILIKINDVTNLLIILRMQ